MSARDELAELLAVTEYPNLEPAWKDRADRSPVKYYSRKTSDAILAAGYRKPRTITTAEELDALPEESVVRDAPGDVAEKWMGAWHVWNHQSPVPLDFFIFPATVLYEGNTP